ncbi:uncharacterized protein LOC135160992 [Diachasmimorpha longicaudata]|uniref:uncharacterized protein LOC135160992 n=1 Tax=Diachasmimorpha longicaudata TaxID=58733 RepID=UPI0030B8975D
MNIDTTTRVQCQKVCNRWWDIIKTTWCAVRHVVILSTSSTVRNHVIDGTGDTVTIVSPAIDSLEQGLHRQHAVRFLKTVNPANRQRFLTLIVHPRTPLSSQVDECHYNIISQCSRLTSLTTEVVDADMIKLISESKTLQELTLNYNGDSYVHSSMWDPLIELTTLKKLAILSRVEVRSGRCVQLQLPLGTAFLGKVALNLRKLESISIGASVYLTDGGMKWLTFLPCLKEVRINCCALLTGKFLEELQHVEVVILTGCGIRDEGVIPLLKASRTLRKLGLGGTAITNDTIVAAIQETWKRTNGIVLTLDVSCTYTDVSAFQETPPLLELII